MKNEGITPEGNENLLSQLEGLIGTRPYFYLKFCSEEKYAQDVCDGNLFGNTASYFREKETACGERGQGDKYELVLPIKTEKISIYNFETGDLFAEFDGGSARFQFKSDDIIPIVCFVGIPLRDMVLREADEHHAVFQFPFSEEEYNNMTQLFGKYCVVVSARELEHRIDAICGKYGFDYIFDAVEYCEQNRLDRMKAFVENSKKRFLYKNADLSYQREFRLAVAIEIPDDNFLRFGKLESAHVLLSETLQNIAFSIEYDSHIKENEDGTEKIN